ncbi:MAG: cyclic nucleotide-binding domain-containing protein [Acidobacteriota bacterium]
MERSQLRGHSLFQMLQPKQVEKISNATEELVVEAGAAVYQASEPAEFFFLVREGQVALRSATAGITLHVDDVLPGEVFGTCLCLGRTTYALQAVCVQRSKLLRMRTETLKKILDEDLILGYTVQSYISSVYFRRYIEAITRLQSVVNSLPLSNS